MSKRGQAAGSATAVLIGLIGAAIIIYILMLPPRDRADLLGQNDSRYDDPNYRDNISILLTQTPGTLESLEKDRVLVDFPSFNLYTRTDAIVISEFDSIYLKRTLFDKKFTNITFKVDELKFMDNILLSFYAKRFDGRLTIRLNGHTLMDRELETSSPGPIQIPVEILDKGINVLEFEVSGPGLEFWTSNEYLIENLKITGDLTDTSGQENKQVFLVTEKEKRLLEYAELVLIPDCIQNQVAPLEIYMNKQLVFSSIPDCGMKMSIPQLTPDKLKDGENYITFRSDRGSYLIYGVRLALKLQEPVYPTYYFKISKDQYTHLDREEADLNLSIVFPNNIDYKKGVVLINDVITEIETRNNYWVRDITPYIRQGNNALEIRPRSDVLHVVEVQVIYAE